MRFEFIGKNIKIVEINKNYIFYKSSDLSSEGILELNEND
jgi:hypothetical protein